MSWDPGSNPGRAINILNGVQMSLLKRIRKDMMERIYEPHISVSLLLMLIASVGGSLSGIIVYSSLYTIGKVNIYTMAGVMLLAVSLMLPEIFDKFKKK